MYICTLQLPWVEAEVAVGAGPVPLDPPELPPELLLDPPPELLLEVPLDETPPPSSPPELEVPRIELPLELVPAPDVESEPLELELNDPLEPLEPPLEPPLKPGVPVVPPPPHAAIATHGTSIHVEAQLRIVILGSLSPGES